MPPLGGEGDGKSIGQENPTALRKSCMQKTMSLKLDAGGGRTGGLKSLSTKRKREPRNREQTGCNDQSSPRQLHKQDRYKEDLKQQIEEKKRKQAEERERIRIAIEKEEKRLAKERARIQQEYEEEQRKQKRPQNNQKTPLQIPEPKTHHREKEKSTKQPKDMLPQIDLTREKKTSPFIYERAPSPPIPTLQRKQAKLVTLSSDVSKLSSSTDRSVSAPHDRPVPVRIPPLDKEKQEVIRELSALRKYLRKEQRQLELQRCLTGPPKTPYSPTSRCRMAAFEHANEESVQPSPRRAAPAADVDEQNMTDLNQRKYRDRKGKTSEPRK
ncbi:unnamed protein product [Menidia menidia]|uniref:(Atlantic silverside) hypothetical protein n=1 Tax=Menidia menidia TaxID=238744 RepID=A0A8S4AVY7_9TELE|nr:unnamed protein product [Menidia menidia]